MCWTLLQPSTVAIRFKTTIILEEWENWKRTSRSVLATKIQLELVKKSQWPLGLFGYFGEYQTIFNHFVVVEIEVSPERENIILQMSGSLHLISSSTDLEKLNEKRRQCTISFKDLDIPARSKLSYTIMSVEGNLQILRTIFHQTFRAWRVG